MIFSYNCHQLKGTFTVQQKWDQQVVHQPILSCTTGRSELLLHLAPSVSFSHRGAQAALRAAVGMSVMKKLRMVIACPRKQTSQAWGQILISGWVLFCAGKVDRWDSRHPCCLLGICLDRRLCLGVETSRSCSDGSGWPHIGYLKAGLWCTVYQSPVSGSSSPAIQQVMETERLQSPHYFSPKMGSWWSLCVEAFPEPLPWLLKISGPVLSILGRILCRTLMTWKRKVFSSERECETHSHWHCLLMETGNGGKEHM